MLSNIPKLKRTAKEMILTHKKTSALYFTTALPSQLFIYTVVEPQLSMRKLLWDSQRKKKRYHCYKQNNQMFDFKTV